MSYQVLARKWRPQRFSDVVGQSHVLTALANGLAMGRIHHAYLFSGTRGVGKTSIARLLAKGLNCQTGITATPCGECNSCREIEQGRFIDLIEIDAASRTKVEDTRELLDNVQYAPARGRFKVYLIDEVHMLSRHSFNALLKTLEEPPDHVKFLLATTDPQKLPVTILSRCLQFHLKALDIEQIREQLDKILRAESVEFEARALPLLARAANGSMRDALSLTDQAIAMGQGHIQADSVSQMLGLLDAEQPLALLEALVSGKGAALMEQVNKAAFRGIDWESLLVEMAACLHKVAMVQLLPKVTEEDGQGCDLRLRELARKISPQDLQLYYQTLIVGRKELIYSPDRRMGVEMTLLRALAFHPKAVVMSDPLSPATPPVPTQNMTPAAAVSNTPVETTAQPPASQGVEVENLSAAVPDATAQLLQARMTLKRQQEEKTVKKADPAASSSQPVHRVLERFASASEQSQQKRASTAESAGKRAGKPEAYRWKAQNPESQQVESPLATPQALRSALEHERTPELAAKLAEEAMQRDSWSKEAQHLSVPKLVQQLALNACKETPSQGVIHLRLRSSQKHLNTQAAQHALTEVFSQQAGCPIELTIIEDDNPALRTPLEWRQAIYEEKLAQARQSIHADPHIQTLCRVFDAELDEESIRPV